MRIDPASTNRRGFLGFLLKLPIIPATLLTTRRGSAEAVTPKRSVLMNDFAIAGFRYYDGPRDLPRLTAGLALELRAEPGNPHDVFAVEIRHDSAKLGYVPRFCNRHLSRLLLADVPLVCEIERLNPSAPPWEAVWVKVGLGG